MTATDAATGVTISDDKKDDGKDDGKLWLSHTQVSHYGKCPRSWYLSKVLRRPRAPSLYAIMGKVAHGLIEDDLRAFMDDGGQFSLSDLQRLAPAAFDATLDQEDPDHILASPQADYFRLRLHDALRLYVEKARPAVASFENGVAPIAVERRFDFSHPLDGTVRYVGVIDVVTERIAPGSENVKQRTLRDWKFIGKPWRRGEELRYEQADAYLWAIHGAGVLDDVGEPLPQRAIFATFPLRQDLAPGDPPTHTLDWRVGERTPLQIKRYADHVLEVAGEIRAGVASPEPYNAFAPKVSALCAYCDHIRECDAGLQEVARRRQRIMTPELPARSGADSTTPCPGPQADSRADSDADA